jgi:DNA-binding transcriptional regulator YhcF (GntR family)
VNAVSEVDSEALAAWQARCKSLGLLMTAPRRAILSAMLRLDQSLDAVALLQEAREHHAGISIGTVYRFLRELEQLGLVQTEIKPHSRCRWRLRGSPRDAPEPTPGDIRTMLRQVQSFLHDLEKLGLAEALQTPRPTFAVPATGQANHAPLDPSLDSMREIAERLGYRLV